MSAKYWSNTAIMLGLALSLAFAGGCGGSPPPPTPSPSKASASPSASPSAAATPEPTPTATSTVNFPNGPNVRQSLSEYDVLKRKGMDLALGRGYEKAIPLLSEAAEQNPEDAEVQFYLLLSKGNLEEKPSVRSESYAHARNVLELAPQSNEASRAMDYIAAAESEARLTGEVIPALPSAVSAGSPTPSASPSAKPSPGKSPSPTAEKNPYPPTKEPALADKEIFVSQPNQQVVLPEAVRAYESMVVQLTPDIEKRIWQSEVYPKAAEPVRELPKGLKGKIQASEIFHYNIASWKGQVTYEEDDRNEIIYDANTYRVGAVLLLIELKDGREIKAWFVNHLERMQPDGTWKVLIGNRLQLERGIPRR